MKENKDYNCIICGKRLLSYKSDTKRYCSPECKLIGGEHSIERTCDMCGEVFKVKRKNHRKTRCDACDEKVQKVYKSKSGISIGLAVNQVLCKKKQSSPMSLASINAAARACGMSYGEYVSKNCL